MKTRTEIIEALQAHAKGTGPRVHYRNPNEEHELRYHHEFGPQYLESSTWHEGTWHNDPIAPADIEFYYLVTEPRRPVEGFVEVAQYKDAQKIAADNVARLCWNGRQVKASAPVGTGKTPNNGDYWVAIDLEAKQPKPVVLPESVEQPSVPQPTQAFSDAFKFFLKTTFNKEVHSFLSLEEAWSVAKKLELEPCTKEECRVACPTKSVFSHHLVGFWKRQDGSWILSTELGGNGDKGMYVFLRPTKTCNQLAIMVDYDKYREVVKQVFADVTNDIKKMLDECAEPNTKPEEPKPPEGFAFSDKPGVVDSSGCALAWAEFPSGGTFVHPPCSHGAHRWLVPAAPKQETKEAATIRFINWWRGGSDPLVLKAFLVGAGIES